MFKFKVVGEVKVRPDIRRNDWKWKNSTPSGTVFVGVRKDVEAGNFDVVQAFCRDEGEPDFYGDGYQHKVYDTYAEALAVARKLVLALEADPMGV
jgi:hypothetical protein